MSGNTLINKSEKYNNIDGIRAYVAILMVFLHTFTNGNYKSIAPVGDVVAGYVTNFSIMFFVISGFSMCCGYYDKFKAKQISPDEFYSKRYLRTLPYFAFLVILDVILSPSWNSLYEGFADLTLCFGFLPNARISVIGVGWTLGVIFAFYLLFPFFVFLMSNKRRAWCTLIIVAVFQYVCEQYFFDETHVVESFLNRCNIIYSAIFFVVGGIVYLYRENLKKAVSKVPVVWFLLVLALLFAYVFSKANNYVMICLFASILIYCVGRRDVWFLFNPVTKFLSKHSMEIYLSHMVMFRVVEKLNLLHIFQQDILSYIMASAIVIGLTIVFSWITKYLINRMIDLFIKRQKEN